MQSGLEAAAGVREGDLLAGKYRVDRILGAGAMGVVVAAHHVQLDTKVAIKFILPAMLANQEAVRRFAREARAAVRITSEHVARVFDVGTLETGAPYIVMEFLNGMDLANWLQGQGPLPIEQAVDFILHATVAVAEAHGLGIVHRDLKPSNLFCIRRPDGQLSIKVLDFGISKVAGTGVTSSGMEQTKTSSIVGSPLYMSPEQMQSSRDVDARTDIWALGVILYELITGKPPFDGTSLPEVCNKVTSGMAAPMRSFRPSVPMGLEAVIVRCLEKAPRTRYQNVAELAVALLEFGSKRAKASVERISGIIQSAGLSASALALPQSPDPRSEPVAAGSIAPLGRSTPGILGRRKVVVGTIGVLSASALAAAVGMHGFSTPQSKPLAPALDAPLPTTPNALVATTVADASSLWVPTIPPPGAIVPAESPKAVVAPSTPQLPFVSAAAPSASLAMTRPLTRPTGPVLTVAQPTWSGPPVTVPPPPATPPPHAPSRNPLDLPLK